MDAATEEVIELTKAGRDLAKAGKREGAIAKFKESLRLDNNNTSTLNTYVVP
ncbi:MAG: hypothetical protein HC919_04075 [Oscillatoriales cyanobacterium SM2_2_1]|nr:hypothetical protein [Oscillatoriales cyanobacterium SM2_2_1]